MMKKAALLFSLIVVLIASPDTGFAQEDHGASVEAFLAIGSEPAGDLGTGYGLGVGLNIPFNDIFNLNSPSRAAKDLMIRADISYFSWEGDTDTPFFSVDEEFTRIPIFLGIRFFLPDDIIQAEGLRIYGEAGVELSFDEAEVKFNGFKESDDEINFGVPIGVGMQYYISEKWYLGLNARLHIISDDYFTLAASMGFDL
jgi:hypothetical protein